MGRKCCVPECRSNYNKTKYVSSFLFPKDEARRDLWIKSINRKDFIPNATSVVCIKHFSEHYIMRQDSAVRDDGTVITVPRMKPKLTEDAYPTLFPNQPSDLSSEPPRKRRNPAECANELDKRDEDSFQEWPSKDSISSFGDFRSGFVTRLVKEWLYVEQKDYILFYKIESVNQPKLTVSFKIHCDLRVSIWHGMILLNMKSFQHILQKHNKCDKWTKFDCLINMLGCYGEDNIPVDDKLSYALKILVEHKSKLECDEDPEPENNHLADILEPYISKLSEDAVNLKKIPGRKRKKMQSIEITSDEVGNSSVECPNNQKLSCLNLDEKDNSECVPAVSLKVEESWEKESKFTPKPFGDNSQDSHKLQIEIKDVRSIPSSFCTEAADENRMGISETSSHFTRPLKILKREQIFGTFVASELSNLSINPELYLKTKRAILDLLIQAHFELINCDS